MSSAGALYASGLAAYRATSFETAVELFSDAISLAPKSAKLYDARATAYEKLNKLQEGLLDARQVVKLMPTSSKGYLRAAKMLKAAKKYSNAEALLQQGLTNMPSNDEKGRRELEKELEDALELRRQAEHSPFSTLPYEIFLEIITLATASPDASSYTSSPIPRTKPARVDTLFSAMRVCRTWYRLIKDSPHLWTTLRVDGVINGKNAERKVAYFLAQAAGAGKSGRRQPGGSRAAHGLRRLVLTAAQDFSPPVYSGILDAVRQAGSASTLREIVLSFVDGSRTTVSVDNEASRSTEMFVFVEAHARETIESLSVCSGGRIYPDFDITSMYLSLPSLTSFHLWGSTTSNFVLGLRAPFLRNGIIPPSLADSDKGDANTAVSYPRTRARHFSAMGAVFVADSICHLDSFPDLETLNLDVIGASIVWELFSAPKLRRFEATVYGESHVLELPMPDLERAWAQLESLRLGGAKRFAQRLFDEAIRLGPLRFDRLTHLDLSFASLSTAHLTQLFDSRNAPLLADLVLASTMVSPPDSTLSLPARLDALRTLDLSYTMWTTDATLREVARCAPRIERLAVRGNAFVTGRPIMELVRSRMPPVVLTEEDGGGCEAQAEGTNRAGRAASTGRAAGPSSSSRSASTSAPPAPRRYSLLTDLALEGCTKIETAAVEWLKKNVRPGGVKFQFLDPADKRGRSAQWMW
ncbi:uncharacterized protein JCM10292_003250 [Rhodotorula paludigena]|uniref:uncharacterized protein n=1 Tax=Rhodotorula paludigena TaxID=86838 RepID=UPI00317F3FAB